MANRTIETDYLVVGAGAAGMAFTDALIADSDAQVVMVDRRHAPGEHWHDAYPFVRLHQPSAYYGVNSTPLGTEQIDPFGPNKGMYERATAAELCAYYDRVMQQRLLPSGRVRYFPMSEFTGSARFVSRVSGDGYDVKVRRKVVDATYLEPSVPATFKAPFEVSPEARCVPPSALAKLTEHPAGYVIIGAGKTALDVCCWLLDSGVSPQDIRWVKPREAWFLNRTYAQGGERVGTLYEGISLQVEAAAQATSLEDLFVRLEAAAQLLRVDETVAPSMFKSPTVSIGELAQLKRIEGVVRLGKVRRIDPDAIVLERGTVPTTPHHLHVHCAAPGLNPAPAVPIFSPDRITLQSIRTGLTPFNSALIGFIEATRADDAEKNRLCPPNRLPDAPRDWARGTLISMTADHLWSQQQDLVDWLERARLNAGRGLRGLRASPQVQASAKRIAANVRRALANLEGFARVS